MASRGIIHPTCEDEEMSSCGSNFKQPETYRSIDHGVHRVQLLEIPTISVGIHASVVVHELALSGLIHSNLHRYMGMEVRDLEGGVDGVL